MPAWLATNDEQLTRGRVVIIVTIRSMDGSYKETCIAAEKERFGLVSKLALGEQISGKFRRDDER